MTPLALQEKQQFVSENRVFSQNGDHNSDTPIQTKMIFRQNPARIRKFMTSSFQQYMGLGVYGARIITDRSVENQCIYT